jgi:hypothetical protein
LADETVLFELVSASNFLLTGKLTRKFPVPGVILQNGHAINAKFQSHAVKFPKQKNRESFEASREMTKLLEDGCFLLGVEVRPVPDQLLRGCT